MNQPQHPHYMEAQHPMSGSTQYASQPGSGNTMSQYPPYQQHHQQPPPLQPGPGHYTQSPVSYGPQYGYSSGMTSPHAAQPVSSSMTPHMNQGLPPLPTMQSGGPAQHTYIGAPAGPPPNYHQQQPDNTGQVAPAGMKPRVTATLWEDEGCMCFQVETKGVCVARRDDNHMINGTKLLNVAGMTRGRRDGILKSEKTRNVVKIGPMHLKGVWIPFDRALDFANKEKITEALYPLFVHNIGALLYHPTNQSRTSAVIAQQDRRRQADQKLQQGGIPSTTQPASLTHHHSMNSTVGNQQPASIAPSPSAGRPSLDRAHTFPTPPTSASGTMTGIGSGSGSYDWTGGSMSSSVQGGQPMGIENHPHSTPATPATTPPGALPNLQPYQSQQSIYPAHSSSQYPSQHPHLSRSGSMSNSVYAKQEMGPPSTRVPGSRPESEHGDVKPDPYAQNQANDSSHTGEEEAEHEQDSDYNQPSTHAYSSHRGSYDTYAPATALASYPADSNHIASEVNAPSTTNGGSGRATPRTSQAQWTPGYQTPPRAVPPTNLYNPTSDARGSLSNGTASAENYVSGAYAPTQMNGVKRMREDDDIDALKRRKGSDGGMINGSYEGEMRAINRPRPAAQKAARAR